MDIRVGLPPEANRTSRGEFPEVIPLDLDDFLHVAEDTQAQVPVQGDRVKIRPRDGDRDRVGIADCEACVFGESSGVEGESSDATAMRIVVVGLHETGEVDLSVEAAGD